MDVGDHPQRVRNKPAEIRRRPEIDPVDLMTGQNVRATRVTGRGADATTTADATGDTARLAGDADTAERQATRDSDTTGASDVTATDVAERHGDMAAATRDTSLTPATGGKPRQSDTTTRVTGATGAAPLPEDASGSRSTRDNRGPFAAGSRGTGKQRRGRAGRATGSKVQQSFTLEQELLDRARSAVFATRNLPEEAENLSQLVSGALREAVEELEARFNGGEPFPRIERLPSGPSGEGARRGAELRAQARERQDPGAGGGEAGGAQSTP